MPSPNEQIAKGLGRVFFQSYRVFDRFQVTYSLVKDLTDVEGSKVDLTIYLKKTPSLKVTEKQGGRRVTLKPSGGQLSQEALPIFLVARESLKSGGVFYEPSNFDEFVEVGTTEPIFYVKEWETIGEVAAGYRLTVTTDFNEFAGG